MSDAIPSTADRIFGFPRPRKLWWAVLAFWIVLAFLITNQIYWGMRDHGHSWWRIFLWQAGACVAWTPLILPVLALARRVPPAFRPGPIGIHLLAALGLGAVHLLPVAWLEQQLDPYEPMRDAGSFREEYVFMLESWLGQDVVIYVALVGLAALAGSRERRERERLRASRLEAELARAELRALRLELQPHFIFNAMNSVVGLLRSDETERAETMLIGLSELLRRTLERRGVQEVSLAEELHLARLYLEIQEARFGERLQVAWEIAEHAERARVPSLLLQPLVENAVHHGVSRRRGRGRIEIRARRKDGRLILVIRDDGPGPVGPASPGLGLENVSSRLEALYSEDWSLELKSPDEGGAEVFIDLPWSSADGGEVRP